RAGDAALGLPPGRVLPRPARASPTRGSAVRQSPGPSFGFSVSVVDGDDARVAQLGGGPGLAVEALQFVVLGQQARGCPATTSNQLVVAGHGGAGESVAEVVARLGRAGHGQLGEQARGLGLHQVAPGQTLSALATPPPSLAGPTSVWRRLHVGA